MQMQWEILQPDHERIKQIQQQLQCHRLTATVLINRSIDTAQKAANFVNPSLDSLPSPSMFQGMQAAVERIHYAIQHDEKILVFGDYDADGVTATVLLINFLKSAGAAVSFHLPHRMHEGYGLQPIHITQVAVPNHIQLIITVDCGSSSHEAVTAAGRFGIDVIVTDHHNIDETIPKAKAVINPKLSGHPQELADLAGVGVAFYLTVGLRMHLRNHDWWQDRSEPNLKAYCDLVALGTIADMVPIKGINRVLTKAGLHQMNTYPRPGIQALAAAAGIRHSNISSEDVAFRLTPRINAAGRMAHAKTALDLLNAQTMNMASKQAEALNGLNLRRQGLEKQILDQIVRKIEDHPQLLDQKTIVLADRSWHEGVLGIVATKLAAQYYRPVILIAMDNEIGKGSGRSIPGVDLFSALNRCAPVLDKFGGHCMAAGLTIKAENINQLRAGLEAAATELTQTYDYQPRLKIDSEIQFNEISPRLLDELENLAPFGADNPAPLFMARDVRVKTAAVVGRQHRRMALYQCTPEPLLNAIQFNIRPDKQKTDFFNRLAFRLQWNRFNETKQIQLVVEAY